MNSALRVLIVHESPVLGAAFAELLRSSQTLCAQTQHVPPSAVETAMVDFQPDVAVVDLSDSGKNAIASLKTSDTGIVALVHGDNRLLGEAAKTGVESYARYSSTRDELLMAIQNAAARRPHLPTAVATRLLDSSELKLDGDPEDQAEAGDGGLTDAERHMLKLVLNGHSTRAMAEALGASERTVARRLRRLYTKLNASDRLSAVKNALAAGGGRMDPALSL